MSLSKCMEEKDKFLGMCFKKLFAPNHPVTGISIKKFATDEQIPFTFAYSLVTNWLVSIPKMNSCEEVTDQLVKYQVRTAAGSDKITNFTLQYLPEQNMLLLVDLINACCRLT